MSRRPISLRCPAYFLISISTTWTELRTSASRRYPRSLTASSPRRLTGPRGVAQEVLTALGERDGAVRDAERRGGGALLAMTDDEGLSVREAVEWCGSGAHCVRRPGCAAWRTKSSAAHGERAARPWSRSGRATRDRSNGSSRWRRASRIADSSPSTSTRRPHTSDARTYPAAYCAGLTTAAEPPPRRTGSAAATTRPSGRNSTPVAAPISGVGANS
jgi:hypothetical protein